MRDPLSLRDLELPRFDPFGLPPFCSRSSLLGMPVVIEDPRPRYTLPDDVPPPTGMTRAEFAEWSLRVCGYAPTFLRDGDVLTLHGALHMTRTTWRNLQAHLDGHKPGRP